MHQEYSNYETIILDDSSKPEYINKINMFSKENNVRVIRRESKIGFKAGNLNNYLQNPNEIWDYFVVLDSDEIIPSNYIKEVLKYFYFDMKIGAVQARHICDEGKNAFQDLLGMSVKSNGQTCQIMKNFYGSNALIGHGMTISRPCYEKTGGFPLVVAEDISFAVKTRDAGYKIVYAPNIVCIEEFPNSYIALKKRQCKWTQGNIEYMKNFSSEINSSNMSWYEKLDLKLSHYSLPIVPMLSLTLVIVAICLGLLNYDIISYSYCLFGLMLLFLLSPLIPDIFVNINKKSVFKIIPYFIVNIITYASLSPMMIKTVLCSLFGKKATFIVTPKDSKKITFTETIKYSRDSLLTGTFIGIITYLSCHSVIPTIIIWLSCLLAPFVIILANFEKKAKKKEPIQSKKIQVLDSSINTEEQTNSSGL